MKTTNDFFIPDNEVKLPEELDYSRVDEYIRSAEAFSRSTYQSVYIIDYFKQNFLYVSPNPMFLCGLTPEQMMKLGYRFYLEYVPEDEQQFLIDLNEAGFSFHHTIPVNERKDWYISYDFHILNGGKKILVNHKLTSLVLTSDGRRMNISARQRRFLAQHIRASISSTISSRISCMCRPIRCSSAD